MSNSYFRFKQFTVHQDRCAMKVTTDACLFGAWAASEIASLKVPPKTILDIGTGTGLLSLMLAQQTEGRIDAVEIDADACAQAAENFENSPWSSRLHVSCGDIRTIQPDSQYHLIISNPPFYQNELKGPDDKKNMAHHSEALSLPDLFRVIQEKLSVDGSFAMLLPAKRLSEIDELTGKNHLAIRSMVMVRQSVNHNPFRILLRGDLHTEDQAPANVTEISICDVNQQYTPAFISLLSPYYLAL